MKFREFLNPKSMITPGLGGGLIMVISNTLWVEFAFPKTYSSLILSMLLAILALKEIKLHWYERIIYFILNSLIIFSLAVNANSASRKISEIDMSSDLKSEKNAWYKNVYLDQAAKRNFFDPYFTHEICKP